MARSRDELADWRTQELLAHSSSLVRARWAGCALLFIWLFIALNAGRTPPAVILVALAAIPFANLTWTLLAKRARQRAPLRFIVLAQVLVDGLAVGFVTAHLEPLLLPLVLLPVTVARDEIGRFAAVLVAFAGGLGVGSSAVLRREWLAPSTLLIGFSVASVAAFLIWLCPTRQRPSQSDRPRAKAAILWQMAASLVAPLLNRAGMIRARADHIDLVLPENDVGAIATAGRVIKQSADEIQQMLRPWRALAQVGHRQVSLHAVLSEYARKHFPQRLNTEPGVAAIPTVVLESSPADGAEPGDWTVDEAAAQSAVLLLESFACRSNGSHVVHARLSSARKAVILCASLTASALPHAVERAPVQKGWSRLMLRTSAALASQSGGKLILWRRARHQRGADLRLPRSGG